MIDRLLTWVILPALVFILTFQGGMYIKHHADHAGNGSEGGKPCVHGQVGRVQTAVAASSAASARGGSPASRISEWESVLARPLPVLPRHELIETDPQAFHKHRFDYMGDINTESVVLLQKEGESQDACDKYANPLSWLRKTGDGTKTNCLAVVKTSVPASPPIIRYKPVMPNLADPGADGHGFFTKVTIPRSRVKTALKFKPFASEFDELDGYVKQRLASRKYSDQGIDTLVVMVVNAGELDLFLNLACSAHLHGIGMEDFVVFAGSAAILPMIETTGALGLYHPGFFGVSKAASHDYLDFTFVDMMWYKCFSIYLILREGYNLVFQDVDLVWFRDPVPYFKKVLADDAAKFKDQGVRPLDAVLSDDGQRSLRYTPFFANSGFFYLHSNPEVINFAYGIMTAFPMIQRLGSQQNMFTMRLLESMTNFGMRSFFVDIQDFPNGYLYHHDKPYMKKFLKHEMPEAYNFHMCWTQGKKDKLKYMKASGMWYLSEKSSDMIAATSTPSKYHTFDAMSKDMCSKEQGWM